MTALSPRIPRRSFVSATRALRVRADEAVINQWLLDQATPARRPAAPRPRPATRRLKTPAAS